MMATKKADGVLQNIGNKENIVYGKSNIPVHQPQKQRLILGDIKNKVVRNVSRKPVVIKQDFIQKIPIKIQRIPKPKPVEVKEIKNEVIAEKFYTNEMDVSEVEVLAEAFSTRILPGDVNDIDAEDSEDPQLVSNYVNDIYKYLRQMEIQYSIRINHLNKQTEITGNMRGVLIDWLVQVQVHAKFNLLQETLYLTVAIIDRFLQECEVKKREFQLVGVTAMFIASKYEEIYPPGISQFVYITDKAYKKKEILRMECLMLKTLNFSLGRPLPLHFLRRNSKAGDVNATTHTLAKYFMETTIVEYDLAHYSPSHLAAAALYLSMKLLDNSPWNKTLVYYSQYDESQLLPLVYRLSHIIYTAEKNKLQAIHKKYTHSKFLKISTIPQLKSKLVQQFAEKHKQSTN
ncbi:G2/mitotic-specific cyclin-B-like [Centruroides sculpturatus]|uniref:G2/mitotic-specific cyclin-B-like n=1 Tax=Centruroides sculpturatus TaxID=218467 RepID=UPI000C6E3711|nr:G2/mitotic-specific cyclin-B-like [Centruroides sculpturatus]